jgi:Spy/CpxP family protein refolding chaperone
MLKRVIGVVAVLALVLPAAAQETPIADHAHDTVVNVLQLTPDQVTQWDALLATRRATAEPIRENLQDVGGQLKALLAEDNPDPAAVGDLVIQARDLRAQIAAANQDYIDGFEALLNDQQAKKLKFLRAANKAARVLPAFRLFGLVARDQAPGPGRQAQ